MILSDTTLAALIATDQIVTGPDGWEPSVQPASIDIRLGDTFTTPNPVGGVIIPERGLAYQPVPLEEDGTLLLTPNAFVLGTTLETIHVPNGLVGILDGKSTLARMGLYVHITAGYLDPGFTGQVTLEIVLAGKYPMRLTPGMKIGQLVYVKMDQPARAPYGSPGLGSHYQGQMGATGAQPLTG